MSARRGVCGAAGLGVVLVWAIVARPSIADDAAIERALAQKVTLDLHDTPLQVAVDWLQRAAGIAIRLDPKAFDGKDHCADQKVSLHAPGISAEAALNRLVYGLSVASMPDDADPASADRQGTADRPEWTVADGAVLITSETRAWSKPPVRLYDVADLIAGNGKPHKEDDELENLAYAIIHLVEPHSWKEIGGGDGTLRPLCSGQRPVIEVSQLWHAHREIERLLAMLRAMRASPPEGALRPSFPRPDAAEQHLRRALAEPVSIEFDRKPLADVARHFEERLKVPVRFDRRALEGMGLDPAATVVTGHLSNVSAESALDSLLKDVHLAWAYEDEVVWITTPDVAEEKLSIRVFDVSDLVTMGGDRAADPPDYDSLIDLIQNTHFPDSWQETGGGRGIIAPLGMGDLRVLIVQQESGVFPHIESTLNALRALRHVRIAGYLPSPVFLPLAPAEERVRQALARKVSLDLDEVPLNTVLAQLEESLGIRIALDEKGLDEISLKADVPVSIELADVTAESALNVVVRRLGLTYTYWDEVLQVTTPDRATSQFFTRVYDVYDLVTLPAWTAEDEAQFGAPPERQPPGFFSSGDYAADLARAMALERAFLQNEMSRAGEIDEAEFDSLIDTIENCIQPDAWCDTGAGAGAIAPFDGGGIRALAVSQTWQIHRDIEALLRDLRAARRPKPGAPAASSQRPVPPAQDAAMRAALFKPVTLDFQNTPLRDVAPALVTMTSLPVVLDERALEQGEVRLDKPVTFQRGPMPLGSALDVMLRPLGLVWAVDGELLWITTADAADSLFQTKVYDVSFIVPSNCRGDEDGWIDFDSVIDGLENGIEPGSWSETGAGQAAIGPYSAVRLDVLVVSQSSRLHEQVEAVLGDLRALCHRPVLGRVFGFQRPRPGQRFERVRQALAQPVAVDLNNAALPDVARFLEKSLGVPVGLDETACQEAMVPLDTRITVHQTFFTAPTALDAILTPAKLTWAPYRGVIWITTPDGEKGFYEAEVFDVYDLPGWPNGVGASRLDFDGLIEEIKKRFPDETWESTNAPDPIGAVEADGLAVLYVYHTWKVRRRVEAMLAAMARK